MLELLQFLANVTRVGGPNSGNTESLHHKPAFRNLIVGLKMEGSWRLVDKRLDDFRIARLTRGG
jgi:hypothetical protein